MNGRMALPRNRSYVFTVNNPAIQDDTYAVPGQKFLCWQVERGASGTVHLQGVITFSTSISMASARRRLAGAHVEVLKGTLLQAMHYCEKPVLNCDLGNSSYCKPCAKPTCLVGSVGGACHHCATAAALPNSGRIAGPFLYGDRPVGRGKRTDIDNVLAMVKAGKREREIAEAHFGTYLKYYKGINRYASLIAPDRSEQTVSVALWGPPGSGKSRRASEFSGTKFWVAQPRTSSGGVWFDGYEGDDTLIFDEFTGWLSRNFAQRLSDRYPLKLETKGGSVSMVSKRQVFTSNRHPSDWWKDGLGAMERRLEGDCGSIEYVGGSWKGVDYPTADSWLTSEAYASFLPNCIDSNYPAVSRNLRR